MALLELLHIGAEMANSSSEREDIPALCMQLQDAHFILGISYSCCALNWRPLGHFLAYHLCY